jgi:hypothetical protein
MPFGTALNPVFGEARIKRKRDRFEILRAQLENERSSFDPHWRDLSDYILPRRARFTVTDTNKGQKKNQKIIDSTATLAAGTLRSGMQSNITSPTKPWFRITTPEPELAEVQDVKVWLNVVQRRMSTVFLRSNLYNILPIVYGDMGVFGTAAMLVEEDFDQVVRFTSIPIGSYYIANDRKGKVRVFFREFRMTVRQLVEEFGEFDREGGSVTNWDNFSTNVRNQWTSGFKDTFVDICHVIAPNEQFDPDKIEARFKKYSSTYYEKGTDTHGANNQVVVETDRFLRESGFDHFPVLAPRWEVTGEDSYATNCPGMVALGDIRQLQLGEKRAMQAIEKMVNPPMVGPSALRTVKTSILPGDITYSDERDGQRGFRPAHEVNPRIVELEQKQEQVRERIRQSFFVNLFLQLTLTDRREITAREIDERHEEKLQALGPVLEQLNQDLLDPLIDITFDIMVRQGLIPPPPEDLAGQQLKVEYISALAQAQKLIGLSSIQGIVRFVGEMAQLTGNVEVFDKLDADQAIDEFGEITSVPPAVIRPDDVVQEIRQVRIQQQQAAAAQQQIQEMAGAAKDLAGADMDGNNALTQLVGGGAEEAV